ncbi:MAG: ECF-type sigma factor [Bryobacterales bacterium]|nr:ECF-type sigma factor [Bryobacterales bacterium]
MLSSYLDSVCVSAVAAPAHEPFRASDKPFRAVDYLEMRQPPQETVTGLLHAWRHGDAQALESLLPLIYDQLHRIASHAFARESNQVTLQPTALINELFVRMLKSDIRVENRVHFFAICARVMRAILVDHARLRNRAKRGGEFTRVTLHVDPAAASTGLEFEELNQVLDRLKDNDPRLLEVVEMHYFGGLTHEEIASALTVSPATVYRDLKLAKAWIRKELKLAAKSSVPLLREEET